MPNYWNPNNFYPTTYGNSMGYPMGQTAMPMQRMSAMMQAMQNPMAFVLRAFPDIPEGIRHDARQILSYLQQSRGISDAQIQAIRQQMPGF